MGLRTMAGMAGLLAIMAWAQPAGAATRFVACNEGDDLRAAVAAASPGDALILSGQCEVGGNILIDKNLSLLGGPLTRPVIAQSFEGSLIRIAAGDVVLDNLVIAPQVGLPVPRASRGMRVSPGASVTIKHTLIQSGFAETTNGGGVWIEPGGAATIEDSELFDNFGQAGGGIYNEGALHVSRTTIHEGDSYVGQGSGIHNRGTALIEDSELYRNFADNIGGAIYNAGWMEIRRSYLHDNRSDTAGGGISNAGDLVVRDTAIVRNAAGRSPSSWEGRVGGALSMGPGSTALIANSTLSGNVAGAGGAIWNDDASVIIKSSTISDNQVLQYGAGVANNTGTMSVESTVVSGNRLWNLTASNCAGPALTSHGANFLGNGCAPAIPAAGDLVGDDPKLVVPTSGLYRTLTHGHASPLVDAGRCLGATDQRGVAKPQGPACDIGALENRAPNPPPAPKLLSGSRNPNQGTFVLELAGSDPDGDKLARFRIEARDADDTDFSQRFGIGMEFRDETRQMVSEPEGTLDYRLVASDGNYSTPGATLRIVVDRTPPAAPSITPDRGPDYVDADGNPWYADEVVVSVEPGADPVLPDRSPGSGTVSPAAAQHTYETDGLHTTSEWSFDAAGNASDVVSVDAHVDATAPQVSLECPERVGTGTAATATWTASDGGSGLMGAESGTTPLDTSGGPGTRIATFEVQDRVGHTASAECSFELDYAFSGFAAPLKAPVPAFNAATAGQLVQVKFSLGSDHGLDVLAGAPSLTPVSCSTGEPAGAARAAIAARPFAYDASKDAYTFWWQTLKEWRKTCVQFALAFDDGTVHRANVRF